MEKERGGGSTAMLLVFDLGGEEVLERELNGSWCGAWVYQVHSLR